MTMRALFSGNLVDGNYQGSLTRWPRALLLPFLVRRAESVLSFTIRLHASSPQPSSYFHSSERPPYLYSRREPLGIQLLCLAEVIANRPGIIPSHVTPVRAGMSNIRLLSLEDDYQIARDARSEHHVIIKQSSAAHSIVTSPTIAPLQTAANQHLPPRLARHALGICFPLKDGTVINVIWSAAPKAMLARKVCDHVLLSNSLWKTQNEDV